MKAIPFLQGHAIVTFFSKWKCSKAFDPIQWLFYNSLLRYINGGVSTGGVQDKIWTDWFLQASSCLAFFIRGNLYSRLSEFFPQGAGNFFIAAALLKSAREDRGFGCMWGFGGANPSFLIDCIITSCMDEEDAGVGRWRTEDGRRTRRRGGGDGDGSHSLVMLSFFEGGGSFESSIYFFGSLGKYHSFYVKSAWWRNKCCGKGMTGTTFRRWQSVGRGHKMRTDSQLPDRYGWNERLVIH